MIANALHIMPEPEKALREIHRVLKDQGYLFAPTFVQLPDKKQAFLNRGRLPTAMQCDSAKVLNRLV